MTSTTRTRKDGVSLAKGPVGLLGLAMLAFGVLSFLLGDSTLSGTAPVDGDISGDSFLGVEGNGWTNLLWIAAGALLAFGAPFHWGAKSMALIVGLVLGAASVISMADADASFGDGDVLGILAANRWTMLLWGASSALLLLSALLPRVGGREEEHAHHDHDHDHDHRRDHAGGGNDDDVRQPALHEPERADTGRFERSHAHDLDGDDDLSGVDPQVAASRKAEDRPV